MAKNRDPRRGFVARWFHRLRRLNRLLFVGGLVVGVVKAVQGRSAGGGSAGGTGQAGGGPGGSGRPAPMGGGPAAPRLAASVAAPAAEDPELSASAAPSAVRTLTSVPPLVDDSTDEAAGTANDAPNSVVVPLADVDHADESDESDDGHGTSTAPMLTIVSNTGTDSDADGGASAARGAWVAPLESGGCPDGYPIKANDNSGIYHVPGGRSYNRTVAERCYASTEAAEADGYRPAKR